MKYLLATTCLAAGLFGAVSQAGAQECGPVTIANINYASAELLAYVDQFVLEHGYGCDASVTLSDTLPTLISMAERGQPDIMPESWASLRPPVAEQMIADGKLKVVPGSFAGGGVQGVYVPRYLVDENPEIKTIADAVAHPELFSDPEDPSRGAWYAGQQGWGGTVVLTQYYKAYGAEAAGFNLVDTGSAAAHDGSLTNAYEQHKGWIGYYWDPTSLLGRYDMVRLSAGVPIDQAEWERCNKVENCEDPVPNEWPADNVDVLVTKEFAERSGPAYDYLTKRNWPNEVVSKMLAWMADNQATGEDGAIEFLSTNEDVWQAWVTPEAADAIKAAL